MATCACRSGFKRCLHHGAGIAAGAAHAPPGIDIHLTRASAERQARALADGGKGGEASYLDKLAADGRRVLRRARHPDAQTAHAAQNGSAAPSGT